MYHTIFSGVPYKPADSFCDCKLLSYDACWVVGGLENVECCGVDGRTLTCGIIESATHRKINVIALVAAYNFSLLSDLVTDLIIRTSLSEFGTYRLCEQRRFR